MTLTQAFLPAGVFQGMNFSGVTLSAPQPQCFACSCVGFSRRPWGGEGGNTNLKMIRVHSSYTLIHLHIIYLQDGGGWVTVCA